MVKVLITGGAGLLGCSLRRRTPSGHEVVATWRSTPLELGVGAVGGEVGAQVELCDAAAVAELFDQHQPDLVIHTAYTQNDHADVVDATGNIARSAGEHGARLIHLSSDVVFDGERGPYDEGDPTGEPVDDYGKAKLAAEVAVKAAVPGAAIVRTSLLVEVDPPDPRTAFVLDGISEGKDVGLFVEELRCPLAVDDLAEALWQIASLNTDDASGVWHLAGTEALSRYSYGCLLYTSPSPRDQRGSRMPSSA